MSWARALVRKAVATTDLVLRRGPPPPLPAPSILTGSSASASASASASTSTSASASGSATASASSSSAASTASAAAPVKLSPAEELEKLRGENAKLKHTFQVIKVKLDKTGKASATLEGAGTPAAAATSQTSQEVRDLIQRILAQERSGSGKLGKSTASLSGSTASLTVSATTPSSSASATATAAATTVSSASGSVSALSAGIPASASADASAPSAPPLDAAAVSASTAFESAQRDKYGSATATVDTKQTVDASGSSASVTATPVAVFYGEDVYATKAEAEAQSGAKLLAYGQFGVSGKGVGQVVHARDPRYASCVYASDELGVDEEEVIIVDLDETKGGSTPSTSTDDDANWFTVVENPNPDAARADADDLAAADAKHAMKEEPALHLEGRHGTAADGFAIVEEEDMISAISDYSAQCVRRFPGARAVDPQQLHTLLQSTFAQAEPPSTLGRIWQWGSLAYTGYGWASYAYYLAKQPAVVRGAYSVVKWVLVLVL